MWLEGCNSFFIFTVLRLFQNTINNHRLIVFEALLHNLDSNLDSNDSLTAACVAAFAPPTIHLFDTHNAKYNQEAVHPNNSVYRSSAAFFLLVRGIFCKSVGSMKNSCGGFQPSLGFRVVTFSMKHPCAFRVRLQRPLSAGGVCVG